MLAPDGQTRLTRSGRGPHHAFGHGSDLATELDEIAKKYRVREKSPGPAPDFNRFALALNVAAADQRVLVLQAGKSKKASETLSAAAWSDLMIGRFHYDVEINTSQWTEIIEGEKSQEGIMIIHPDPFGQKGKVLAQLPYDVSRKDLAAALTKANKTFTQTTEKKNYSNHVSEGRRKRIFITMPVEFGEDRDGDGKIDHRGARGRRRSR
ncbi:MAG: hypothetical protein ACON5H_12155 [Akkermansiaceae bacterium]